MKSRLATSILSSFLYMNLGGRILVCTLLAVIVTAAAGTQSAPAVSPAEARKAIQARVALGKNTIERMLAPDLYVQTPDRKLTRQEFIDAIFSRPYTLTRFDATVLTVEPRGNDGAALVLEKLEAEIRDNSGKTSKIYVMGVVRDGWGQLNGQPVDPPMVRATGPATVGGGDSADRKLVTEFPSDVLRRSRFS
jgi:hypothetical protein